MIVEREYTNSQRKNIPDGNMDLHKEMKNTRTGNYIGKYIRFVYYLKSLKDNLMYKQNY